MSVLLIFIIVGIAVAAVKLFSSTKWSDYNFNVGKSSDKRNDVRGDERNDVPGADQNEVRGDERNDVPGADQHDVHIVKQSEDSSALRPEVVAKTTSTGKVFQKELTLLLIILLCLFVGFAFNSGDINSFSSWDFDTNYQGLATILMFLGVGCSVVSLLTAHVRWLYKPEISRIFSLFVTVTLLLVLGTRLKCFGLGESFGLIIVVLAVNISAFTEPEMKDFEAVVSALQIVFLACFVF